MADKEIIRPPQEIDFLPQVKWAGFRFLQQIAQWVNAAVARLVVLEAVAVTNGNSHDHSGGDGAQIAYSGLSGLPTHVNLADRGDPAAWDNDSLTTDGAWHDLDLSSILPAGAKAVLILVNMQDDAVGSYFQVRKNGNTNAVTCPTVRTQVSGVDNDALLLCFCDTSRVIEYRASNVTFALLKVVVLGWVI